MIHCFSLSKQNIGFLVFIFLLQMDSYAATCVVNGQVPDIIKRSRTYQADGIIDSDPYINDNYLRPGWYSAATEEGQYLMPDKTSIPNYLYCGTKHPVYLKDQHPNLEELEENVAFSVTACELYPYSDCVNTFELQIRKCNGELHYYLLQTSSYSAYCFDPPEIQGETSFPDPPDMTIGILTVSPKLDFTVHGPKNDSSFVPFLKFLCTENGGSDKQRPNIVYTTYWYIDHQLIFVFSNNSSISQLTEGNLMSKGFSLGIHMRCGVRISDSIIGLKSPLTRSNDFFAGIKVYDKVINMDRTDTYTLKFTQTVPFGCYGHMTTKLIGTCKHKVHMITSAKDNCAISDTNTGGTNAVSFDNQALCGFEVEGCYPPKLTGEQCNTGTQDYSMTVTTQSFGNDFTPFYSVRLETQNSGAHNIWKKYTLGNVNINVHDDIDIKDKSCYSHVDPHMKTVRGRTYGNHDDEGEFMLYWNKEYDIQVQERTTQCVEGRSTFCTCAVAVRSGGDVFLINLCNSLRFIGMTSCKDNSLLIEKYSELEYQVQTNIGTLIKIRIRPYYAYDDLMNIDIVMAPKDYQSIRGLCGMLDSNPKNDFHDRNGGHISYENSEQFINEWRLRNSDKNFLTPTCKPNVKPWLEQNQRLFCLCNCDADSCRLKSEATCSPSQYINCTVLRKVSSRLCDQFTDSCKSENRKRRSAFIIDPEVEMQRKASLSRRIKQKRVQVKRQAEYTISRETATNMCIERINGTTAVQDYSGLLGEYNVTSFIQDCIFDVYETQDVGWIGAHETATKDAVQIGFKMNSNYTLIHNDELLNFKRQYCLFNCSGNGNCTDDGICKCEAGYFGTDCSNDVTNGPEIEDVEGGGFCDTRYGSECQCFEIQTRILAENFHCKRVHKLVLTDGSEQEIGTDVVFGEFKNLFMGECCFEQGRKRPSPETYENVMNNRYDVSISNDGIHFGSSSSLYIYDSTCLNINLHSNVTFEIKNKTCIIQGVCYEEEDLAIDNDCFKCNAVINQFNWTYSCVDSHNNKPDDQILISTVIPVALSVVAGILVICVVCLVMKMKTKSKRSYFVTQRFKDVMVSEGTAGSVVQEENIRYQDKRF